MDYIYLHFKSFAKYFLLKLFKLDIFTIVKIKTIDNFD